MKNYSSAITGPTPQTQPLFGRTDQVKNNAGGYVFEVTPKDRLARFLLIGSEGGTYYVNEQKLTQDNATNIISLIKADGLGVVATVTDFAVNNRAPKADPGLFVLALCATYGDSATKTATYNAITKVCKTSTHLFTFLANVQNLRGWSRGLRKGVAKFYTDKEAGQVAYAVVKYRNRAGFTHRDALRLSHAKATSPEMNDIFAYVTAKDLAELDLTKGNSLINAFETAQKTENTKELVELISEYRLTWEMVPNTQINKPEVLQALLENMPLTALLRNLNRFSYNGLTDGNTDTVKTIVKRLKDKEYVQKSGIHPLNVVNSMRTYSNGRGDKGDKTWTPNQKIVDALSDTYEAAVQALPSTGKNILVAVDVSGSMRSPVAGYQMSAVQVGNVLGVTMLKAEDEAELIWFDTSIHTPKIGRRTGLDTVLSQDTPGGGTDCSLAFMHALNTKIKYDTIIILTDNETWSGRGHGLERLNEYRRKVNKDVKVIEVAMVSNPYGNLPADDKNLLRVVGFDASVIDVIQSYLE
jgi:60 kDa SS-A/Ro ribonucleoprotein